MDSPRHSMNFAVKWTIIGAILALFLAAWFFCSPGVPVEDDYDAILNYLCYPASEHWRHLLDLHNEHRIGTTCLIAELITRINGCFNFRCCIFIGDIFMIGLAALWYRKFKDLGHEAIGLTVFALSLSLLHWANQLNALCSVQNILAVLLPLAALLVLERRSPHAVVASLMLAVLATFTSGSGVLIWPAMILVELVSRRRKLVLVALVATALIAAGIYFGLPNTRPPQVVKDVAQAGETLLAKTTVMGYTIEITPMFILRHIAYAANYFLACVGGVMVIPWLNVLVGAFFTGIAIWLGFTFKKTKGAAMLGMLFYLLACCASCGVFRAASFMADVPSRYQIVCVAIFATLLYLVLERNVLSESMLRKLSGAMLVVSLTISVAYFIYAFPILRDRTAAFERNMLIWPQSCNGLQYYPEERRPHAAEILKRSRERGVYRPQSAARLGIKPPEKPIPEKQPRF